MHESGLIQKLLAVAQAQAQTAGGTLTRVHVRLGVLAGGSAAHLREHFELELRRLGLADVGLGIVEAPDYPGGVEITGIELRR